jgi:hypothetical protein
MYTILVLEGNGAAQTLIVSKILQKLELSIKNHTCLGNKSQKCVDNKSNSLKDLFDHVAASGTASLPAASIASGNSANRSADMLKKGFTDVFQDNSSSYLCTKWYHDESGWLPVKMWYDLKEYGGWLGCKYDVLRGNDSRYSKEAINKLVSPIKNMKIGDTAIPLTLATVMTTPKMNLNYYDSNSKVGLKDAVSNAIADKRYFHHDGDKSSASILKKLPLTEALGSIFAAKNGLNYDNTFVVAVAFDNPNTKHYNQASSSASLKDYMAHNDVDAVETLKSVFPKKSAGHFYVIKVTEADGLKSDIITFDQVPTEERINEVLKTTEICTAESCKAFADQKALQELVHDLELYHHDDHISFA